MVDVKVSGTVRAKPSAVFGFLAELENWPRWQSDMRTTTLVAGLRGEAGARYRYVSILAGLMIVI
jgi:polyketide cyclase/dehydrase/lipid transport protein